MRILAIDPGTEQSAFVVLSGNSLLEKGILPNADMLVLLNTYELADECAIEMVASMGMAVGMEVFETVYWIGRFSERWEGGNCKPATRVYRKDVKMYLCGSMRAKDANIRQRLIDLYGGKDKAVGKKKTPGPLYGVSGDCWSALAVGVTAQKLFN